LSTKLPDLEQEYSTGEVSEYVGLSKKQVNRLADDGFFPCYPHLVGGTRLELVTSQLDWLDK
jgi:hypothetical protein